MNNLRLLTDSLLQLGCSLHCNGVFITFEHSADIRDCQAKPKPPASHFKAVAESLSKKQIEAKENKAKLIYEEPEKKVICDTSKSEPGPSRPKAEQKKDPSDVLHKVMKLGLMTTADN